MAPQRRATIGRQPQRAADGAPVHYERHRPEQTKRVFEIDMEHCPNCGGELKIIAAILEQPLIEKILTHLGLQARAPPRSLARGQALQAEPGKGPDTAQP